MSKILVTGGCGFIGTHLANQLAINGHKVTVIDRAINNRNDLLSDINVILSDIRSHDFSGHYDVIYHLAALRSLPDSSLYPEEYISTNVYGTQRIVSSFPRSRIVFASSSAAAENKSVYGISKKCGEHFMNMHMNAVSIRFMNVFGEGQTELQMAVPAFCWALKHGKRAIINGDGSVKRDYTYVKDLCTEMIRIGESKIKGQTETGYGEPIKIIDLYKLLARLSRSKEFYKLGPSRKEDMRITCSKYRIKEPQYGFTEGMRRTVRWYMSTDEF